MVRRGPGAALPQSVPDRRPDRPGGRARLRPAGMAGGRDPVLARCHLKAARSRGEEVMALARFLVRWLHPSRRRGACHRAALGADPLAPPQDEVLDPHGEERGKAARLEPRGHRLRRQIVGCVALLALLPATAIFAQDDSANRRTFSSGYRFVEMTGEELFANVCQGCHMPDATGSAGAGTYPSLAADKNLAAGSYPVYLIINGRRGMPAFGDMMTDGQVAAVVNY